MVGVWWFITLTLGCGDKPAPGEVAAADDTGSSVEDCAQPSGTVASTTCSWAPSSTTARPGPTPAGPT